MSINSLHKLMIPSADGEDQRLENYSLQIKNPHFDAVEIIFRNEEQRLLEIINEYNSGAIFGCIAWLTSIPILKALGQCHNVQIIVQKEDFLRPDLDIKNTREWKKNLSHLYGNLSCRLDKFQFREPICNLSTLSFTDISAIRCVGNHNSEKSPAFPRMHHKFLVFCKLNTDSYILTPNGEYELINEHLRPNQEDFADFTTWYEANKLFEGKYLKPVYVPVALWTGSFNLTKNATHSFENAVYFVDNSGTNEIINAYLGEHHQIYALSEPLNWETAWIEPEFRIGT